MPESRGEKREARDEKMNFGSHGFSHIEECFGFKEMGFEKNTIRGK
jgi:hypothetical protein